jgi:methionyl-tRNA formyltransferase
LALLFADTVRSRAYSQGIANAGITADRALVVQSSGSVRFGQTRKSERPARPPTAFVPDLSIPLDQSVRLAASSVDTVDFGSVNDEAVQCWLRDCGATLAVYSGFGGEIVRDPILRAGVPLLHALAGWLPDYRGSTTVYYSLLVEGRCGVSAILLNSDIDSGPVIDRRWYPPPAPHTDVDHLYDVAIRTDLLVDVLRRWRTNGGSFDVVSPQPGPGTTYYVMHPVLRAAALRRIDATRDS